MNREIIYKSTSTEIFLERKANGNSVIVKHVSASHPGFLRHVSNYQNEYEIIHNLDISGVRTALSKKNHQRLPSESGIC